MLVPVYTTQFERDVKRAQRRGKDLEKFKSVARVLLAGQPLDPLHRDHRLVGMTRAAGTAISNPTGC